MEQHDDRHDPEIFQENREGQEHQDIDIDVSSEGIDDDNRPDYPPRKNADIKRIVLGIVVVAAIIGLTWYAFNAKPVVEVPGSAEVQAIEPDAQTAPDSASPADSRVADEAMEERSPDGVAFSPTPETIADAEAAAAREAEARAAAARKAAEAKAAEAAARAAEAAEAKAAPAEAAETGSAADVPTEAAAVETEPAEAKAAETTPAETKAAEVKPAEAKPAETKSAEAKPTETKTAEVKPAEAEPAETKSAEAKPTETKAAEVKPAEDKPAETKPAEVKPAETTPTETKAAETTPPATLAISDKWVVNISSTPDATESHKLLMRILGNDLGGRVYSYETTIDGKQHYRIRVGFFTTRAEAEAVGQKVFDDFKLSSRPWAVQPTVDEVDRYGK